MNFFKYIFLFSIIVGILSCDCEEDHVLVDDFELPGPTPLRVLSPAYEVVDSDDYIREFILPGLFQNPRYFKIPIIFDQPVDTSTIHYAGEIYFKDENGLLLSHVDLEWNDNLDELTLILPEVSIIINEVGCLSSGVLACTVSLFISDAVKGENGLRLDGEGNGQELGDFYADYLLKIPPTISSPLYASEDTITIIPQFELEGEIHFDAVMDTSSFIVGNTITLKKIQTINEDFGINLNWNENLDELSFFSELSFSEICPEFNCLFEIRIKGINSGGEYVKALNGLGIDGGETESYNPDDDFVFYIYGID